ncbi:hypothetical protein ACQP10_38050 (plasmid) [Streptosporangium sandarakinum]|uniref:hypothetical protein n=1 Tax=Streptosporangium sandarakinum TaxID=1260955 RepID=UPI003D89DC21
MSQSPPTDAALPAVREPAKPGLLMRALRWAARKAGRLALAGLVWVLKKLGRRLWRHRDLHVIWWAALALYLLASILYLLGAAWWIVGILGIALVAGLYQQLGNDSRLPLDRRTVTAAAGTAAAWVTATTAAGPINAPIAITWAITTIGLLAGWGISRPARAWRHLRIRVRHWTAALPAVLAELGAAGVVLAARPAVHPGGRVDFPLRLPPNITRAKLDKLRAGIEVGMHWPESSIREVAQDPRHAAASRVVMSWSEGKIQARVVRFAPPQIPTSFYDELWLGGDDDGNSVLVVTCVKGYGTTRGLYAGATGSTKSNLLRLIAWLRANCPDTLIWAADLKSGGKTFASLLPRIDYLATDRAQFIRMLEDAAAIIPLRGELLLPEHNQVLPVTPRWPGIVIIADEVRTALGKKPANAAAIDATAKITSEGRALAIGMEAASQYMSQDSMHPSLLPNFDRSVCGRTRTKADSQHVLRNWHRLDTTMLPAGAFYFQTSGSDATTLLFTPEVTDAMLAEVAINTAHLSPTLEESTASRLPHYADRWAYLPDHLLHHYASEEQRRMVLEARTRLETTRQHAAAKPAASRTAAANDRPRRLVVVEHLDAPAEEAPADADHVLTLADITDAPLREMARCHLSSPIVTTAESNKAAEPRVRQWATDRRTAWEARGIVERDGRGKWRTVAAGESDFVAGVLAAETDIRAGRAGGGEAPDTRPGHTRSDLGIPLEAPSSDLGIPAVPPAPGEGFGGGVAHPSSPPLTVCDVSADPGPPPPSP